MSIRTHAFSLCLLLVICCAGLQAQHSANANATYQQLRGLLPGNDVISVNNLEIRRDAATFTLRNGNIAFFPEVNGNATGAVFKGDGHIHITPPTAEERHNLSYFNHEQEFDEDFDEVVLRFTDSTAEELRKASTGSASPDKSYAVKEGGIARHHPASFAHELRFAPASGCAESGLRRIFSGGHARAKGRSSIFYI